MAITGPRVRSSPAARCQTPWASTLVRNHGWRRVSAQPARSSAPKAARGAVRGAGAVRRPPRVSAERAKSAAVSSEAQPPPTVSASEPAAAGAATFASPVATPSRALTRSRPSSGTAAATSVRTAGVPKATAAPVTAASTASSGIRPSSPVRSSTPVASWAPARTRSATSTTRRAGNRSAATPATGSRSSMGSSSLASTRPRSPEEPPRSSASVRVVGTSAEAKAAKVRPTSSRRIGVIMSGRYFVDESFVNEILARSPAGNGT